METKLFLARLDAVRQFDGLTVPYREAPKILEGQTGGTAEVFLPIPMILFCPSCGVQHIDVEEPHKADCGVCLAVPSHCTCDRWTNPPHRPHFCGYCQHIWRPADVLTTGVHEIAGKLGSNDSQPVIRRTIDRSARFQPQWRHKRRGKLFTEIARGEMLTEGLYGGDRLVAYRNEDNKVWFRPETEFDDGRFERAP